LIAIARPFSARPEPPWCRAREDAMARRAPIKRWGATKPVQQLRRALGAGTSRTMRLVATVAVLPTVAVLHQCVKFRERKLWMS
jgi:hypothetical protein